MSSNVPKISQVAMLVEVDNYSQVELYGRIILSELPDDHHGLMAIAWANLRAGLDAYAALLFNRLISLGGNISRLAIDLNIPPSDLHGLQLAHETRSPSNPQGRIHPSDYEGEQRFLLIKAWGFGFWSDVLHVLGGLMLAELTRRQPVVFWGSNSLYSLSPAEKCV